jgi:hypothetical protein
MSRVGFRSFLLASMQTNQAATFYKNVTVQASVAGK